MRTSAASASVFEQALRRWRWRRAQVALLHGVAVAAGFGIGGSLTMVGSGPRVAVGLAVVVLLGAVLAAVLSVRPRSDDPSHFALHLDRVVPELQESGELLMAGAGSPLAVLQRRRAAGARLPLAELQRVAGARSPVAELQRVAGARSPLAELQRQRAAAALAGSTLQQQMPRWPWARLAVLCAGSLVVALALGRLAVAFERRGLPGEAAAPLKASAPNSAPAPTALTVAISAPAYTGRAERVVAALDFDVEEGAVVRWRVEAPAAQAGALLFDEGELALVRGAAGEWSAARAVDSTRVYALVLRAAGAPEYRSPYARLAVLPDRPPTVRITQPQPLLAIDPANVGSLRVEVGATDDYGLADLDLVATVARGAGEQVEFRVQRWPLGATTASTATVADGASRFARTLDLRALGLVAGSELYLQAEAHDRRAPRPNVATSEAVRVLVAGGAGDSVGLDRGLPRIRVATSLRSQRQIIADSERLLAERTRLAATEFQARSESLGFDQRALRLRYGGLLGEEAESGSPGPEEEAGGEALPASSGFSVSSGLAALPAGEDAGGELPRVSVSSGLAALPAGEEAGGELPRSSVSSALAALPEGFVHRHDSQDVATYFDDPERARMKAALAEMWGAEGNLRLGDPRAALPFEYRALRLLKSAQEQARVYVAKLGAELPKLDLAKRLAGELKGIDDRQVRGAAPTTTLPAAEFALAVVAGLRAGTAVSAEAAVALAATRPLLARAAVAEGGAALAALDALAAVSARLERGEAASAEELASLERGLVAILPLPLAAPGARAAGGGLEKEYRRALKDPGVGD